MLRCHLKKKVRKKNRLRTEQKTEQYRTSHQNPFASFASFWTRKGEMFSFFKSKKPSPPSSPELDPIPGPDSGYVVVDPARNPDPNQPRPNSMYPNFDGHFGVPPPTGPYAVNPSVSPKKELSSPYISYLHGVPFKLSSELSTGDTNEITKIQIDDILALITSKMEVSGNEYDFGLERSIIAQEPTED